jgi:glutaminyl-tRNA synthetase
MTASSDRPVSDPGDGGAKGRDFIRDRVTRDVEAGKNEGRVHTRFPPEPNGYLHLGHAKSICLNFGVANEFPGGLCNLRFDDTNPIKEEEEFVRAIEEDVRWLGFDWSDRLYFASDYYPRFHDLAVRLIRKGKAYVDDLTAEEIREHRGTLTEPGRDSPHRDRPVEENLDLFERMRRGEFPDGSRVLRAKIDMASGNINMRDPVLYRVLHADHHRTGDAWCIYPMYDFAHPLSDALEGITHSLCTLEFEDHRPLYDWVVRETEVDCQPVQIEFAHLRVSHTVLSKRKLKRLVDEGHVSGWDDPRMPTLRGLRRRGYTPAAIRNFCDQVGMSKRESLVDIALLDHCVREDLNRRARRAMGVLRPLRLVIENYPEDRVEELDAVNNPEDPSAATRKIPFSRVVYIERDDFMEHPPPKFFRLTPGREVRLRYGYLVTCTGVVRDDSSGEITEVRCTYDPDSKSGTPSGRRVKGTLHWVSAPHAVPARVRLFESLFERANPGDAEGDFLDALNPESMVVLEGCRLEPSLADARPGQRFQFERLGYFCMDPDSAPGAPVFNRTVSLRDTWARIQKAASAGAHRT